MDSLTPGLLVVARYRLEEPLAADLVGVQSWAATDQILDRPVRVSVIEGSDTALTLDAARRAALISDAHLTRVLDVLHDGGRDVIVTEPYTGTTLADLVEAGPLSAGAARAIIGSAAKALEAARRRGVHHGALRPSSIRVRDGVVRVTGLGIDGTVPQTRTPSTGDEASREDSLALVALLYYALTGVLPAAAYPTAALDPEAPALAHLAPGDPVVPPRDLVPGVPNDLDTLCVVTLGPHDDGPHTPGELVHELAPWDEEDIPVSASEPVVQAPPAIAPATGVTRQSVRAFGSAAAPSAGSTMPGTPPPAGPVRRQSTGRIPRVTAAGQAAGVGLGAVAAGAAGAGAAAASASEGAGGSTGAGSTGAAATTVLPAGSSAASSTSAAPAAQPQFGMFSGDTSSATTAQRPVAEPSAPMSTKERAKRFHFNPTPVILALMVVLLVVGGVLAKNTLFTDYAPVIVQPEGRPGATPPAEEAPAPENPDDPAPTVAPPAQVSPVVLSVEEVALPGSVADDHPELADRAIDSDAQTAWYSLTYKTANFGGFDRGVGLLVTLEKPAPISSVFLSTNNTGGAVEIRAAGASDPAGGTLLASGPLQPETSFSIDPAVETSTIVVWLTELPQVSPGEFRANIYEIAVS